MSENFIKRDSCPCCSSQYCESLLSLPYSDPKIWFFLDIYYKGRIPKKFIESDLYNILCCENCGLLFQEYILNDSNMFLLYEKWISADESFNKKKKSSITLFKNYAYEIERIASLINKKPFEIKVLEYGMGWGFWSNLAKAYNYNVTGVELSDSRINYAKKSGLNIIDDISHIESNSFDYIYSNQVFEHIANPREVLSELTRILKTKGIIHIRVPDGRGMKNKLASNNWTASKDALHPLEHINCFTRSSLITLAKTSGLSLVQPRCYPKEAGVMGLLKSHVRCARDKLISPEVFLMRS